VVDEVASLYQYSEGRLFLETLAMRARKRYLGITFIIQDPTLLQGSSILANCATQILFSQAAANLSLIEHLFHLSEPEMRLVRSFGKEKGCT